MGQKSHSQINIVVDGFQVPGYREYNFQNDSEINLDHFTYKYMMQPLI